MLPDYITKTTPNPSTNRAPWYTNTAPTYAGIFLWVVFYMNLADGTINRAGLGLCLLALLVAGVLCYKLYYYVPAMLGMKTGYPLYVVGSSTFGTTGGFLMPGLLMGLLQVGWFSVGTFVATKFILAGIGSKDGPGTMSFAIVAILWGYIMAFIGVKGIRLCGTRRAVSEYDSRGRAACRAVQHLGRHRALHADQERTVGRIQPAARRGHRLLRNGGRGRCGLRHEQP